MTRRIPLLASLALVLAAPAAAQAQSNAVDVPLAAGYHDNGGPGERPVYHPGYYAAFVLDPDGNNVEVVSHSE